LNDKKLVFIDDTLMTLNQYNNLLNQEIKVENNNKLKMENDYINNVVLNRINEDYENLNYVLSEDENKKQKIYNIII